MAEEIIEDVSITERSEGDRTFLVATSTRHPYVSEKVELRPNAICSSVGNLKSALARKIRQRVEDMH